MAGYRFCRTDDVPLLVDAYNRCYLVHFDGERPLTVADFKRDTRELALWASSCMIAFAGDDLIGVLLSGKRDEDSLIHRIGIHPDHLGQGHGRHLLTSLGRKLAILGPPRMRAEIPAGWRRVRAFFESCAYRPAARFVDFTRDRALRSVEAGDAVVSVPLAAIVEEGAFDESVPRSWERTLATLRSREERLDTLAVGSDRIEAYLVQRPVESGGREIVALGHVPGGSGESALGLLLRHSARTDDGPVRIPRVSEGEVAFPLLESFGFRPAQEYVEYTALATTA